MSRFRVRDHHDRRTLMRVTAYHVTVAAAGLALIGTVGVLPSASASSRATIVVAKLDHQLCYTVTGSKGFRIPTGVVLKNQFNPNGFPVRIGPAVLHCNPVVKIIPGAKFPILRPRAHLACFKIVAPPQKLPQVNVTNQFGTADLAVGQPLLLCLPSWKGLAHPPRTTTRQPPGLGHFTCYPVRITQGAYKVPSGIMLKDEFSPRPVRVKVSNAPVLLCVPTLKFIHRVNRSPYINRLHLLCFPVSRTPRKPVVFDKNQFGTAIVRIGHTALLCLPSTKTILASG